MNSVIDSTLMNIVNSSSSISPSPLMSIIFIRAESSFPPSLIPKRCRPIMSSTSSILRTVERWEEGRTEDGKDERLVKKWRLKAAKSAVQHSSVV
jgi:hypothetical protein